MRPCSLTVKWLWKYPQTKPLRPFQSMASADLALAQFPAVSSDRDMIKQRICFLGNPDLACLLSDSSSHWSYPTVAERPLVKAKLGIRHSPFHVFSSFCAQKWLKTPRFIRTRRPSNLEWPLAGHFLRNGGKGFKNEPQVFFSDFKPTFWCFQLATPRRKGYFSVFSLSFVELNSEVHCFYWSRTGLDLIQLRSFSPYSFCFFVCSANTPQLHIWMACLTVCITKGVAGNILTETRVLISVHATQYVGSATGKPSGGQWSGEVPGKQCSGGSNVGAEGGAAADNMMIPDLAMKHPLQNRWALWFFKNDKSKDWAAKLKLVTTFDTVEDFWAYISVAWQ